MIGNRYRPISIIKVFAIVDAEGRTDRGEEIRNADWVTDDAFRKFIRLAPRSAMIQPAARENTAETESLVASSAAAVKFRGATEFRCDNDQRFV